MTLDKLCEDFDSKNKEIESEEHADTKEKLNQKVPGLANYKILIEVVDDIEFKTAICQMDGKVNPCTVCDHLTNSESTYYYGKWGHVPVVVVQTAKKVGPQFQNGSWFETKKALYYMPHLQYVFGVGVCGAAVDDDGSGGLKPRVPLGHVVVSSHIIGYDHQRKAKWNQNESFSRSLEETHFYQFIIRTMTKHKWDKGLHFGRVLSGSWLVADIGAQKSLLDPFKKDEIAFEMEGAGIAAACQNQSDVQCCLIVKGISNYANENKDDTWQPAAAKNAACFLSDMINKKVIMLFNGMITVVE